MANYNFEINDINITIDGHPINIGTIKLGGEISAQELATCGGLFDRVKDLFTSLTPAPTAPMPSPVINMAKPTPSPCPITKPTTPTEKKVIDIKATFETLEENLIKRDGWSTDHLGNLYWKRNPEDSGTDFKDTKVSLEDAIRVHVHSTQGVLRNVHISIHPTKVYVDGISTYYLEKFLREAGIPGLEELIPVVENMEVRS